MVAAPQLMRKTGTQEIRISKGRRLWLVESLAISTPVAVLLYCRSCKRSLVYLPGTMGWAEVGVGCLGLTTIFKGQE